MWRGGWQPPGAPLRGAARVRLGTRVTAPSAGLPSSVAGGPRHSPGSRASSSDPPSRSAATSWGAPGLGGRGPGLRRGGPEGGEEGTRLLFRGRGTAAALQPGGLRSCPRSGFGRAGGGTAAEGFSCESCTLFLRRTSPTGPPHVPRLHAAPHGSAVGRSVETWLTPSPAEKKADVCGGGASPEWPRVRDLRGLPASA